MRIGVTHLGTASVLLELPGLRILTDPVLGGPCSAHFGWGMRSRHLAPPRLPEGGLGTIDAVLLSHDQHDDNLDREGRELLARCPQVITTRAGAARVGGAAVGLVPFESRSLRGEGIEVRVTATPARHGPPLSLPLVGPVIGFALEWSGQERGALWISGDTVRFRGLAQIGERFRVGTAFVHLGRAAYGPLAFTMDAAAGARVAAMLGAAQVVPIHYDGWTHFSERESAIAPAFARAGLADRVVRLEKGVRTELVV